MPLPDPQHGDDWPKFRDRCMGNSVMVKEFPDAAQREAVCSSQFHRAKSKNDGGPCSVMAETGSAAATKRVPPNFPSGIQDIIRDTTKRVPPAK
jgi:hypothetical protein